MRHSSVLLAHSTPPPLPNLVQVQTGAETQVPPTRDLEFSFPGPELSLADGFSITRVCLLPAYTAQCKSEQEVLKVRIVDPEYNGGRRASSVYAGNGDKLWSAPPSLARFDQMQVGTRMQEITFPIIIVSRLLLCCLFSHFNMKRRKSKKAQKIHLKTKSESLGPQKMSLKSEGVT